MSRNEHFENDFKVDPNSIENSSGIKMKIKPKSEPRNKRIQLLLTQSNYEKIKNYAANNNTSVNDILNQIIENINT